MTTWEYATLSIRVAQAKSESAPGFWKIIATSGENGEVFYEAEAPSPRTASHLSILGRQGWELAASAMEHAVFSGQARGFGTINGIIGYVFWFKRPVTERAT